MQHIGLSAIDQRRKINHKYQAFDPSLRFVQYGRDQVGGHAASPCLDHIF
jgi:hypothetical protein